VRVIFDKTLANTLFNYIDGKLFWKERKDAHFKKGNEINLRDPYGYLYFQLNKHRYKVHRVIWAMFNGKIPEGFVVDHINQIRDDNRIENLRLATLSQNHKNSNFKRSNATSKYIGVSFSRTERKWLAQINFPGERKTTRIGCFSEEEEAALAYNDFARELYEEFAVLNIIGG